MSGMPWPIYHAYAHDDWSTVWDWIDDGGDISEWCDETEVYITVTIPSIMMVHTDLIVQWVAEHYWEDFTHHDLDALERYTIGGWTAENPERVIYKNPYELLEWGDDEVPETYQFTIKSNRFWFTWRDMCDTALIQIRDMRQDTGISKRAWEEDAVSEVETW